MDYEFMKDDVVITLKKGRLIYRTVGGRKISLSEANEGILAIVDYWDKKEEQERKISSHTGFSKTHFKTGSNQNQHQ